MNGAKDVQEWMLDVDGGRLFVEAQGQGEPVLLVHGIFASGYCWRKVAAQLAAEYRVYSLDLLGFGRSEMPAEASYAQSAQAERLLQAVDALGLQEVRLVGHSMGGEIAVLAALRRPAPFRQLALVAADGFRPFRQWQRRVLGGKWTSWVVRHTFDEKWFRRMMPLFSHDASPFTDEVIEGYVAPYRREEFAAAMRKLALDREEGLSPEAVGALQVPTLLVWGELDRIVPKRVGDVYAERLPAATYRTRAECGHLPMEECPEWLAEELVAFFRKK